MDGCATYVKVVLGMLVEVKDGPFYKWNIDQWNVGLDYLD